MTTRSRRLATLALTAAVSVGLTVAVVRSVRAIGIPAAPSMYYRGTLDEAGAPVTGSRMFTLRLMNAPTGGVELCTTGNVSVAVTSGAFELPLPAACTEAIRTQPGAPELWQELSLAGAVVGPRTRLGTVPYAVVAERASVAEGALSMQITALQTQVAALGNDNPECPAGYARDAAATPGVVCARMVLGQRDEVVKVGTGASAFWIDRYEAAVHHGTSGAQLGAANTSGGADDVPSRMPRNGQRSGATTELIALSHAGMPSVLVTWFQSNEACRGAGKQLPTGDEWLAAASGTLDNSTCNVSSGSARAAGPGNACRSVWGAHEMIGNLWEWTAEWYAGAGVATPTTPGFGLQVAQNWGADYNDDATWNVSGHVYRDRAQSVGIGIPSAALRGGAWSHRALAGVFTLLLSAGPSVWAHDAGFRCVLRR